MEGVDAPPVPQERPQSRLWMRFWASDRLTRVDEVGRRRLRMTLERGLLLVALTVFASGFVAMLAAMTGTFRLVAPVVLAAWLALPLVLIGLAVRRRVAWIGDWWDVGAIGVGLVGAASVVFLYHRDFIGTFDTAFYLADAMIIAATGSHQLHAPYAAVLPGFTGVEGEWGRVGASNSYSALAAYFAYLGNWEATRWVNAPLAWITVISLYLLGRRLGAKIGAIVAIGFYQTSLITVWLQRWVMTENGATAVFWVSVLIGLSLWRRWDPWRAAALAVTWAFGILVRPESFLVAGWFVFVLVIAHYRRLMQIIRSPAARAWVRRPVVWLLVVLPSMALVVGSLVLAVRARTDNIIFGLKQLGILVRGRPLADAPDVPTTGVGPNWGDYAFRYEWESSLEYLLPVFLFVGLVGVATNLVRRRTGLRILAFNVAYLMWVVMPPVTVYHPWFMRKLWISLMPLAYLLAGATHDPRGVAYRWPVILANSERPRARPSALTIAGIFFVLFVFMNVETTLPLALEREDDGIVEITGALRDVAKEDALFVYDTPASALATADTLAHGGDSIPLFPIPAQTMFYAVTESDKRNSTYVITINTGGRGLTLSTDPSGTSSIQRVHGTWKWIPRDPQDTRQYMATPPLEAGYRPFAQYLRQDVPPEGVQEFFPTVDAAEIVKPLVLQRRLSFEPDEWSRTDRGMEAQVDNATLNFDDDFNYNGIFRNISFYAVYPQLSAGPIPLAATLEDGSTVVLGELASDGSGEIVLEDVMLPPAPRGLAALHLPAGFVARAIYVGTSGQIEAGLVGTPDRALEG